MSAPVPRLPTPKPTPRRPGVNWAAVHVRLICDGDVVHTSPSHYRDVPVAEVERLAAEADRWDALEARHA